MCRDVIHKLEVSFPLMRCPARPYILFRHIWLPNTGSDEPHFRTCPENREREGKLSILPWPDFPLAIQQWVRYCRIQIPKNTLPWERTFIISAISPKRRRLTRTRQGGFGYALAASAPHLFSQKHWACSKCLASGEGFIQFLPFCMRIEGLCSIHTFTKYVGRRRVHKRRPHPPPRPHLRV